MKKQSGQRNPFANLKIEDELEVTAPKATKKQTKACNAKQPREKPQIQETEVPVGFTVVKKPTRNIKPKKSHEPVPAVALPSLRYSTDTAQFFGLQPMTNYQILLALFLQSDIFDNQAHATLSEVCKGWHIAANSLHVWQTKATLAGFATPQKRKEIKAHPASDQAKLWRQLFLDAADKKQATKLVTNELFGEIEQNTEIFHPKDARRGPRNLMRW